MTSNPNIGKREPVNCWICDKKFTQRGEKCGPAGNRRRRAQEKAELYREVCQALQE